MNASGAALVLVLSVVAAAATGDRAAGLLAAVSAAAAFDYFLTVPFYSFTMSYRDDVQLAVALVLVGLAVTEIALWGQRQQRAAARRDGYLRGLLRVNEVAESTADPAQRRAAVAAAITEILAADRCEWVDGSPHWNDAVVGHDGVVQRSGSLLRVEQSGLPTDGWTVIPVAATEGAGYFRIAAATHVLRPTREQLRVAYLAARASLNSA